jgi:hypothetical protein
MESTSLVTPEYNPNWLPELISLYQGTLASIKTNAAPATAMNKLKAAKLHKGICYYFEKTGLAQHMIKGKYAQPESIVYKQLWAYMKWNAAKSHEPDKAYLTKLPVLCHTTLEVLETLRVRILHLQKMQAFLATKEANELVTIHKSSYLVNPSKISL